MTFNNIVVENLDRISKITINRPKVLNALNLETVNELHEAVKAADEGNDIRVIVFTGAGDRAFVAGADISGFPAMGKTQALAFAEAGHGLMNAIESAKKPAIAMVNGYALGGGTELALACDFIYASTNAVFGLPEVSLGIFPGFGGTQRLNKAVGMNNARELIFTGRKIMADEAFRIGLVNKILPPHELWQEVQKTAQEIISNGPNALALVKHVVNMGASLPLREGLDIEKTKFAECFLMPDMKEGVSAFLEKRKPRFA